MNIVNKLTLRHLKENKNRTVITTIGIIISVAMITAVFVAMASFLALEGDITYFSGGHIHASMEVNEQQLKALKSDDRIERVGVNTAVDYNSFILEKSKADYLGIGDIYTGDINNLNQKVTGSYDGKLPENQNEIAVEDKLIEKNNLGWKIGDTVSIPVGERYFIGEDGEQIFISGNYISNEQFDIQDVKEFKITAILHTNPPTIQFGIIRGLDLSTFEIPQGSTITAYIELKEINRKSIDVLDDIVTSNKINDYEYNKNYLASKFAINENNTTIMSILPIIAIILLIIIIASVVLIYNAFAMSLSERVRYLGMLSSVGATRKQKKMSVYYEGFVLGAIGIPLGILAGIAGIGITLKAVGKKIIETGMIQGISNANMNMRVVVPLWAIIGIVLFSVLTIFISSFVPSHKASSVTPIDAIRQREEIKIKAKNLKSPKIIRKIFGYEGELAYKNLKRNGRKGRVITASIAMSVILFMSCNTFCDLFSSQVDMESHMPYQMTLGVLYDDKENAEKLLESVNNIDDYYSISYSFFNISKNPDSDLGKALTNKDALEKSYINYFNKSKYVYINLINEDDFNKLCEKNNITVNNDDMINAVIMNNVEHKNNGKKLYNDKIIGSQFTDVNTGAQLKVAGLVDYDKDNYICNLNPAAAVSVYAPIEPLFDDYYLHRESGMDDSLMYDLGIVTDEHETVREDIYDAIKSAGYDSFYLGDMVDNLQSMNTIMFIMQVFIYGFIALITLITTANIINTISTGIQMRKKEFAMFKSVGTTPMGFNKMVVLESAFYGIKAIIVSIPLSVLIAFGMTKALSSDIITFSLNIPLYLIVIAVVFAIIGLTMLYSVNKLKYDNVVETLKEEIN